jgi:hypothetical protein
MHCNFCHNEILWNRGNLHNIKFRINYFNHFIFLQFRSSRGSFFRKDHLQLLQMNSHQFNFFMSCEKKNLNYCTHKYYHIALGPAFFSNHSEHRKTQNACMIIYSF